jgi:hypothetical protein
VTADHYYSYHQGFTTQAGTPGGIVDTIIIPRHVAFLPCAVLGMSRVHAGGNSAPKLASRVGKPEMSIVQRARAWQIYFCYAVIMGLSRVPFFVCRV